MLDADGLAERGGFEPTIRFPYTWVQSLRSVLHPIAYDYVPIA